MAIVRKRKWRRRGQERMAWVCDYTDQSGKRRSKQFGTKREAEDFRTEALSQMAAGIHTPDSTSITVVKAAEIWVRRCERDQLEASTIMQYRQHVELHIAPLLGDVKLSRLTSPMVEAFRDRLLEDRSRALSRKVLTSLKSLVGEAQRQGLVAQNVARLVKVRQSSRGREQVVIPTRDELSAMLHTAAGRWRPLIVTAIFTGMRASELRGLGWSNVDFEASVISVRQRADRWQRLGPPKSRAGWREIPMADLVVNTLREWKLRCPRGADDLVFPNGRGNVESLANISKRGFAPLQVDCGIVGPEGKSKYGLHALRHAAASLFIDAGLSPKKVQEIIGHASIAITFDVYGHLFPAPEEDRAALARIEARLVS